MTTTFLRTHISKLIISLASHSRVFSSSINNKISRHNASAWKIKEEVEIPSYVCPAGGKSRTTSFADYRIEFRTTLTTAVSWIMHRSRSAVAGVAPGKVLTSSTKMDETSVDYQRQTFSLSLLLFFSVSHCRARPTSSTAPPPPAAGSRGRIRDPIG